MEQVSENNAEQSAAIPAISLGKTLREARERLGLSVADVANQTKFAPRQIEALETDDYQYLHGAAFLRGFVRSYAKVLQLDVQPLLGYLPPDKAAPVQLTPASVETPFPTMLPTHRQNLIWLGAALLLAVVIAGFALWYFTAPRSSSEITQTQAEAARVETPVSLPAEMPIISVSSVPQASAAMSSVSAIPKVQPPPKAAQSAVPEKKLLAPQAAPQIQATKPATRSALPPAAVLRLVFDQESWTEIRDKDGKILSAQINQRGSELHVEGSAPFSLVIGRAASVHLYRQDKQVDLTPYINAYSQVARLTLE